MGWTCRFGFVDVSTREVKRARTRRRAFLRFGCEGWRARVVPCLARTPDARRRGAICGADGASASDTVRRSTSASTGTTIDARATSRTRKTPADVRRTRRWIAGRRRR